MASKLRVQIKHALIAVVLLTSGMTSLATTARAAGATVSGTISAGGAPVTPGSFQVVFIPYAYSACNSASGYPTGTSTIVPVGVNGQFSVFLPRARYRVAFKALSSAPANSLGAWYSSASTDGVASGTDPLNCLLVDSTPLTINHTRTGTRVAFDGSLVTSSNANITSALVSLSNAASDWYMSLNGAGGQVTPDGTWEMGLPPSSEVWLQVKVPATATGQVFCGVPDGETFTLVPALGNYPAQYCDASYKFNFGSLARHDVRLQLPVMGLISGQVTGTDGSIAKDSEVCVTAYKSGADATNWYSQSAGSSCTNASGQFELGVPFDSNPANNPSLVTKYRLQFNAAGGSSPYKSKWYSTNGVTDSYLTATDVAITASAKTVTADLALPVGKTISGVVATSTGEPISNANVIAMSYSNSSIGPIGVRSVLSGSDGRFLVAGLEPGTYSIKASHPDFSSTWLGGTDAISAQTFTIQTNETGAVGKNIVFSAGQSIGGSLSTSDGASTQVCASAYRVTDSDMGWGEVAQSSCFNAPGGWNLKGIQPGKYKIRFDIRDGDYKSQFLGNTTNYFETPILTVNQTSIVNQDITFSATKSIILQLVNEDATAVTTACVTAFKVDTASNSGRTWQGITCSNTSGKYKIRGLDSGDYIIQVTTQGTDYRPGFFSLTGKLMSIENASSISITNGEIIKDLGTTTLYKGPKLDMTLKYNSIIVPNVCVNAILVTDDFSWGSYAGSACSGRDGKLSLKGLLEGSYRLQISSTSDYRGGWITSIGSITGDISGAVKKVVSNTNLDIGNVSLTLGTKATGKVLYDGAGMGMICINAIRDNGSSWGVYENSACTTNSGDFTITGLDPNSAYRFRVFVGAGDFKQGYVNSLNLIQSSIAGIAPVSDLTEIALGEIQLSPAPSIKGTFVSGVESSPEANVCVSAIDAETNSWVTSSCSSTTGKFALRGLEANGTYRLNWWTQNKLLTSGWYRNQNGPTQTSSVQDATVISVPESGIQNLLIRMRNGAVITGTVPSGICVAVWKYPSTDATMRTNAEAIACGNSDGRFELRGLTEFSGTTRVDYYLEAFKKDGTSTTQTQPLGDVAVHTGDEVTVSAS